MFKPNALHILKLADNTSKVVKLKPYNLCEQIKAIGLIIPMTSANNETYEMQLNARCARMRC